MILFKGFKARGACQAHDFRFKDVGGREDAKKGRKSIYLMNGKEVSGRKDKKVIFLSG